MDKNDEEYMKMEILRMELWEEQMRLHPEIYGNIKENERGKD